MHFLLNEVTLNVTNFRDCCLGFFLAWNPYLFSDKRCCDGHFPGFGKYIFFQLQTCTALVLSADCTESSCSSNIVIFNNFCLTFLFLTSNNNFLFPGSVFPPHFRLGSHQVIEIQHVSRNITVKIPQVVKSTVGLKSADENLESAVARRIIT